MMDINYQMLPWPPRVDRVSGCAVDLWCGSLSELEQHAAHLATLLSPDEARRVAAYKMEQHRQRFSLTRGVLRTLLGGYLNCDPAMVRVTEGANGKPSAEGAPGFNVSHSKDVVVYVFSNHASVGVDVEYLDEKLSREAIVNDVFSPTERVAYRAAGPDDSLRTFFNIWVRKEARLKATGFGWIHRNPASVEDLPVIDLQLTTGYVGALAFFNPEACVQQASGSRR